MALTSEPNLNATNGVAPARDQISVVIIEDIREVREGLSALINGTRGFRCVGAYYSMESALDKIANEVPNVILTDIGLPGMSGIRGAEILHERYPQVPVLALTRT